MPNSNVLPAAVALEFKLVISQLLQRLLQAVEQSREQP
jgi:hypothetical protein